MASLQLSSLLHARHLHLRLSRQQRSPPWIVKVYRLYTCKFSKSSGPVRYIPKTTRPQDRRKPLPLETQTESSEVPGKWSDGRGYRGSTEEEMSRSLSSSPKIASEKTRKKRSKDVLLEGKSNSDFYRSAREPGTYQNFVENQGSSPEANRFLPETEQGFVESERGLHDEKFFSPLRLSEPTSFLAVQSYIAKAQKAASLKKFEMEQHGLPDDISDSSPDNIMRNALDGMPSTTQVQDSFCADVDGRRVDNREVDASDDESDQSYIMNDIFHTGGEEEFQGIDKLFSEVQLGGGAQSTGIREAEAASNAAREDAKNQAIRYLAMRPLTAFQLRKKLEGRNISPELADYAIAVVQNCGMQSDLAYAETFARSRWTSGSWGPQRIKQGLKQRGVSEEIMKIALHRVFHEDEDEDEDEDKSDLVENICGMSKSAMDQLLMQASKQWNRGRNVSGEAKVRRMISWLQYRGFNWSVIGIVLKFLRRQSSEVQTLSAETK